MESKNSGYVAGIVHHDAFDDLERCLASLRRQSSRPLAIAVVDTGVDPQRLATLAERNRDAVFLPRPNLGYGAGANYALKWTAEHFPSSTHVLILNPDVELEPAFASVLLCEMDARPRTALASGKLLRPGGLVLDSAGIRMPRHRRARDRGSEEPDQGHYDKPELVFGVSGAAMMIRRSVLADLALDGEVFDEDFFAYQDDTDLAWRAQRLGYEILYHPDARAVHGRRWRRERRASIEPWVRRHSFKNHYLQIVKNEPVGLFVRNLPILLAWELLRLGFVLARDRDVLPAYWQALQGFPRAWNKRKLLQARLRDGRRTPALPVA